MKKNAGDQDLSVETQWSEFSSDATGGAILRVSDDSGQNFAQLARNGDGNICFTIVENNSQKVNTTLPYSDASGFFRLFIASISLRVLLILFYFFGYFSEHRSKTNTIIEKDIFVKDRNLCSVIR